MITRDAGMSYRGAWLMMELERPEIDDFRPPSAACVLDRKSVPNNMPCFELTHRLRFKLTER